ncbi:hypothetical protein MASR2M54_05070 [Aliarcobacter cryaerophilus]
MSKKIALIESGTYYHYFAMHDKRFNKDFCEIIYAPILSKTDIDKFDIIIVADRNHIKFLVENRDKLSNFAKNGGTLCVLGENSVEKWIEGINFISTPTNFWWWLDPKGDIGYKNPNSEHPFFNNMRFQDCKWHYHGVFEPKNSAIRIIEREEESGGGVVLYEESFGKGKLVITSLDPFFHIGSNFMPNADKFLKGLLSWLKI